MNIDRRNFGVFINAAHRFLLAKRLSYLPIGAQAGFTSHGISQLTSKLCYFDIAVFNKARAAKSESTQISIFYFLICTLLFSTLIFHALTIVRVYGLIKMHKIAAIILP
ncbi:hypothetical protein [Candidatus Endolissoclinum faulkneri]|uniref:hypothetical protein n=1 Tax=Candidatus Endolissoclinum faulkneri TaxID=1263979 RepID=UPI0005C476B7|nr:hypothetical protein [Candidatus Endolissoclinum faulkneri]